MCRAEVFALVLNEEKENKRKFSKLKFQVTLSIKKMTTGASDSNICDLKMELDLLGLQVSQR